MKKILSAVIALSIAATAFASCAGGGNPPAGGTGAVTLKVWGPQEEQANLQAMAESFKAANPDKSFTIDFGVIPESDALTKYSEDPAAAADVFLFENGQTNGFVKNGGLYEITLNKDEVISRNVQGSVDAASVGDKLYAYPMTADNGYFLYYDKSVFSEEDVKSLDKMLEVANAAGKKVFMDISNGYYIASFFLGAGCTMSRAENGSQILDFNNENGVKAGEAIRKFTADSAFLTGDDSILTGGMGTSIVAGVSGTWVAEALKEKLGDNFAATKLPTFTCGTEQKQLASFGGYKLAGINSLTNYPEEAMAFANWITNEENQMTRFENRQIGPSNINVAQSEAVLANVALAALAMQNEFAIPQNNVSSDNYWSASEGFGTAMENKDPTDMQTLLDTMIELIQAASK